MADHSGRPNSRGRALWAAFLFSLVLTAWASASRAEVVDENLSSVTADARGEWIDEGLHSPEELLLEYSQSQPQLAVCCKTCRKGKACGNSCISRSKTCSKPPGCACDAQ